VDIAQGCTAVLCCPCSDVAEDVETRFGRIKYADRLTLSSDTNLPERRNLLDERATERLLKAMGDVGCADEYEGGCDVVGVEGLDERGSWRSSSCRTAHLARWVLLHLVPLPSVSASSSTGIFLASPSTSPVSSPLFPSPPQEALRDCRPGDGVGRAVLPPAEGRCFSLRRLVIIPPIMLPICPGHLKRVGEGVGGEGGQLRRRRR